MSARAAFISTPLSAKESGSGVAINYVFEIRDTDVAKQSGCTSKYQLVKRTKFHLAQPAVDAWWSVLSAGQRYAPFLWLVRGANCTCSIDNGRTATAALPNWEGCAIDASGTNALLNDPHHPAIGSGIRDSRLGRRDVRMVH